MHTAYASSAFGSANQKPPLRHEIDEALARLDTLGRVLDSAVRIPGTDVRVGVDAIVGLVPVVGDFITTAISSYVIYEARRLGASRWVIARMAANTTLDGVVGMIPVVGDVFDLMYKANTRNIALLRRHLERQGAMRSGIIEGTATRMD
jgi:Domain of unknown function (DUF4112)